MGGFYPKGTDKQGFSVILKSIKHFMGSFQTRRLTKYQIDPWALWCYRRSFYCTRVGSRRQLFWNRQIIEFSWSTHFQTWRSKKSQIDPKVLFNKLSKFYCPIDSSLSVTIENSVSKPVLENSSWGTPFQSWRSKKSQIDTNVLCSSGEANNPILNNNIHKWFSSLIICRSANKAAARSQFASHRIERELNFRINSKNFFA